MLVNILINDLDATIQSFLSKFADDMKDCKVSRTEVEFRRNLMENWATDNRMELTTDKCKVLQHKKTNQEHEYRKGDSRLGSTTAEKGLWFCVI